MKLGKWPDDDIRRAFVEGACWWEFYSTGATMWQSQRKICEEEAERRFPKGILVAPTKEDEG